MTKTAINRHKKIQKNDLSYKQTKYFLCIFFSDLIGFKNKEK